VLGALSGEGFTKGDINMKIEGLALALAKARIELEALESERTRKLKTIRDLIYQAEQIILVIERGARAEAMPMLEATLAEYIDAACEIEAEVLGCDKIGRVADGHDVPLKGVRS